MAMTKLQDLWWRLLNYFQDNLVKEQAIVQANIERTGSSLSRASKES